MIYSNPQLIKMALHKVNQAKKNDQRDVKYVLEQASICLDGIIKGDLDFDHERKIYLEFLNDGLKKIVEGTDPKKALHLHIPNAPQKETYKDSYEICYAVGRAYEQVDVYTVKGAIRIVARKSKVSDATIRRIWEKCGGLKNWKSEYSIYSKSKPINKDCKYVFEKPDKDNPKKKVEREKRLKHKIARLKKKGKRVSTN